MWNFRQWPSSSEPTICNIQYFLLQLRHASGTLSHLILDLVFVPQNSNFFSKLILCHSFSRTNFVCVCFVLFWVLQRLKHSLWIYRGYVCITILYYYNYYYNYYIILFYNLTGELYFGDESLKNTIQRRGLGGRGGGALKITTRHMIIDGIISVNGEDPDGTHFIHSGQMAALFSLSYGECRFVDRIYEP